MGNIYTYICGVIHNQVKNILFTAKKIQAMVHELFYDDENQVLVLRYNSHFQLIDVEPVFTLSRQLLEGKLYRQMVVVMSETHTIENRETREATSKNLTGMNISEIAFVGGSAANRMIARVLIKTGLLKLNGEFFKDYNDAINWLKSKR